MPQNAACMLAEVYSWPFICIEWWCWRSLVCFDSPIPDASTLLGATSCPAAAGKMVWEASLCLEHIFVPFANAVKLCKDVKLKKKKKEIKVRHIHLHPRRWMVIRCISLGPLNRSNDSENAFMYVISLFSRNLAGMGFVPLFGWRNLSIEGWSALLKVTR